MSSVFNDRFFVTIDVEADSDTHWKRKGPLTFSSVTEGIPKYLRPVWERTGVKPVYFLSPEVLADDLSCRVLRNEIAKGAVIGAHLHPEYLEFDGGNPPPTGRKFACSQTYDEEFSQIKKLTETIETRLGVKSLWYRAGRFGAGNNTVKILRGLGYKYESSVTPGLDWSYCGGPDFRGAPLQPYRVSLSGIAKPAVSDADDSGIMEYPVTIFKKRLGALGRFLPDKWFCYNWLRPSHMTCFEQKRLAAELCRECGEPVFVMMFHSMEIMPGKSPYVRTRLGQRRFLCVLEKTITHIKKEINEKRA
ncbi:MAG: hypothetical protein WCS77_05080 [Elusimicrobiaceae bacterium]